MIISIKKRDLLIVTAALVLIIFVPFIYSQVGLGAKAGVGVWVVISNQNPVNITINISNAQAFDPKSGGSQGIVISFNVSDPDGLGNVNGTDGNARVIVNFTLGTRDIAQFRTHTTCVNTTSPATPTARGVVMFNCTVNMRYYDNNSASWAINVTVIDANGGSATNDTRVFTYNSLASFTITARDVADGAQVNFSGASVGQNNFPAKAPILLNNTGNNDFDQINLTGANLVQVGGASEIAISSFAVNITNNTNGQGIPLSTGALTIPGIPGMGGSDGVNPNATLMHGPGVSGDTVPYPGNADFKSKGNQTLLFFVDIPSGTAAATYNNTWNLTVVDID